MADIINLTIIKQSIAIVPVRGTAPLITHAWSTKAREMMLAAQQGKKVPKQPKNPEQDFEDARYKFADGSGDGIPAAAFKRAIVTGGGRAFGKSVKQTELRQAITVIADGVAEDGFTQLVRINAEPPLMREDMVRVGMGTADIRYRPEYRDWTVNLKVAYYENQINVESIYALVNAAGANGVGEWRPERNGSFGTFEVITD